jgi:hypothetical protein
MHTSIQYTTHAAMHMGLCKSWLKLKKLMEACRRFNEKAEIII